MAEKSPNSVSSADSDVEVTIANSTANTAEDNHPAMPLADPPTDPDNAGADVSREHQDPASKLTLLPPATPQRLPALSLADPEQGAEISLPATEEVPGPPKHAVVVKDVAYATYRAILYYVGIRSIVRLPADPGSGPDLHGCHCFQPTVFVIQGIHRRHPSIGHVHFGSRCERQAKTKKCSSFRQPRYQERLDRTMEKH